MKIEFTSQNKTYRIRRMDSRNIVFERKTPEGWALRGYHNAYSLRFAILDEISNNISMVTELKGLFAEQNIQLERVGNYLKLLLAEKEKDLTE